MYTVISKFRRYMAEQEKNISYPYTVISVVDLTCGDALFQGICNYLQTIEDADFLQ
jgi:hypothetical protein